MACDFREVARVLLMRTVGLSCGELCLEIHRKRSPSVSGSSSGSLRDDGASTSLWTGTTDDQLADAAEDVGLSIKTATWNTDGT
jgi:hypothetical protein